MENGRQYEQFVFFFCHFTALKSYFPRRLQHFSIVWVGIAKYSIFKPQAYQSLVEKWYNLRFITSYALDIFRSETVGILRDLTFHSDSDVTELVESNIGAGMRL